MRDQFGPACGGPSASHYVGSHGVRCAVVLPLVPSSLLPLVAAPPQPALEGFLGFPDIGLLAHFR